jgi:hypothetical protein
VCRGGGGVAVVIGKNFWAVTNLSDWLSKGKDARLKNATAPLNLKLFRKAEYEVFCVTLHAGEQSNTSEFFLNCGQSDSNDLGFRAAKILEFANKVSQIDRILFSRAAKDFTEIVLLKRALAIYVRTNFRVWVFSLSLSLSGESHRTRLLCVCVCV